MMRHAKSRPWRVVRLTADEERDCWQNRTETNRWRLVLHHMGLALANVKRIGPSNPRIEIDDVIAAFVLALYSATGKWDPGGGMSFANYSYWSMRTSLRAEIVASRPREQTRGMAQWLNRLDGKNARVEHFALDPGKRLDAETFRQRLPGALADLSERDRGIMEGRWLRGEGLRSLAKFWHTSPETIRLVEKRLRSKIARKLVGSSAP